MNKKKTFTFGAIVRIDHDMSVKKLREVFVTLLSQQRSQS